MLFKRQRLLLSLLHALGGKADRKDFQKLLFLFTREEEEVPSYDFVPFRYGGFSFTSYADKRKLADKGLLAEDDASWFLTSAGRSRALREPFAERSRIAAFCRRYAHLRGNALLADVYTRFPYYATRSELLGSLNLPPAARERIQAAKPAAQSAGLFTIGYEGRTLESYLNILLKAGISILCDVRRNPISRKYGFSKRTLQNACSKLGIQYEHLPELGIESAERKSLNSQADYDALFREYERTALPKQPAALNQIADWLRQGERVALTCYEHAPQQCHRHCVAEAVQHGYGTPRTISHL